MMCIHELTRFKWQLVYDGKLSSDLRYFEKEDNSNRICKYTSRDSNVRWGGVVTGKSDKLSWLITFGGEESMYLGVCHHCAGP